MLRARPILVLLQVGLLVLGGAVTSGAGASPSISAAAAGSATYTDPTGDAQGGPDVTRVTISGDAATGMVTFAMSVPGYLPATPDAYERNALVWIDTDKNGSTGDPEDGTEYALMAWNDPSGRWWNVGRWNGTDWEGVPVSSTMSFARQGDTLSWTLSTADLGGATSFRFYVLAGTWDSAAAEWLARDDAPETGWWSYDIASSPPAPKPPTTTVSLGIEAPTATPRAAVAGRPLTLRFPVEFFRKRTVTVIDLETGETREELVATWEPVPSGRFTARVTVAGKTLRRSGSVRRGELRLSLAVPKTAGGKVIRVAVEVTCTDKDTGKTMTAKRVVSFRVK